MATNKNVDSWIKNRKEHDTKALENASRHFDDAGDPIYKLLVTFL